jgi:ATP-dependent DNA ligase
MMDGTETTIAPMEAKQVAALPRGVGWVYEPKWDGFRCIAFRDGDRVRLQSKSGKPLERYFPDLVAALGALGARRFVLDGEIVVPVDGVLSFDALLQRVHPAASRVNALAAEQPALFIVFDLLVPERGAAIADRPLAERRDRLEAFATRYFPVAGAARLSPQTLDAGAAYAWLEAGHGGLDGVMAKRADMPYRAGERDGMRKIKRMRSADCVIGGFRTQAAGRLVASLLLGLYDDEGLLHHVGYTSGLKDAERADVTAAVRAHIGQPGFTGRAPGGPSRWSSGKETEWTPLAAALVVEVEYDHFSQGRFRHGTRLLRWRPDKAPDQCTFAQLDAEGASSLGLL